MDFSRISTFKLPHRTTKEIHKCFAREDSKNQKRIDNILKYHREVKNPFNNGNNFEDMMQMSCDLSVAETCDDCNECADVSAQITKLANKSSETQTKVLPSLDDVLEETSFLNMASIGDQARTDLWSDPRLG